MESVVDDFSFRNARGSFEDWGRRGDFPPTDASRFRSGQRLPDTLVTLGSRFGLELRRAGVPPGLRFRLLGMRR